MYAGDLLDARIACCTAASCASAPGARYTSCREWRRAEQSVRAGTPRADFAKSAFAELAPSQRSTRCSSHPEPLAHSGSAKDASDLSRNSLRPCVFTRPPACNTDLRLYSPRSWPPAWPVRVVTIRCAALPRADVAKSAFATLTPSQRSTRSLSRPWPVPAHSRVCTHGLGLRDTSQTSLGKLNAATYSLDCWPPFRHGWCPSARCVPAVLYVCGPPAANVVTHAPSQRHSRAAGLGRAVTAPRFHCHLRSTGECHACSRALVRTFDSV